MNVRHLNGSNTDNCKENVILKEEKQMKEDEILIPLKGKRQIILRNDTENMNSLHYLHLEQCLPFGDTIVSRSFFLHVFFW